MKVIFLDIDGVLNSSSGRGPYFSDMEEDKLKLLKKLIEESNAAGIVITSDRRYSKADMKNKIEAFDKFEIYVAGETRFPNEDDLDDNRGKQIRDYLLINEDIDRIVILDDNDDGISSLFKEEFILVNRYFGLNEDIFQKVLDILK